MIGPPILEKSPDPTGTQTSLLITQVLSKCSKLVQCFLSQIIFLIKNFSNPPALTLGEEEERLRPACKKAYRYNKDLNSYKVVTRVCSMPTRGVGELTSSLFMIPKTSSFQRDCEGVEHVLEEERQVQAEHPAQLPILLPAGRPAENCES